MAKLNSGVGLKAGKTWASMPLPARTSAATRVNSSLRCRLSWAIATAIGPSWWAAR